MNGAQGTLYAEETYQLQVDFPEHYPMEAPQVHVCQPMIFVGVDEIVLSCFEVFGNYQLSYKISLTDD